METLNEKIKNRLNDYLEFDHSLLFMDKNCSIFGGATRDAIANEIIHDVDLIGIPENLNYATKVLKDFGYIENENLVGRNIHEMYKGVHVIYEPKTYINKNLKYVQLIRPALKSFYNIKDIQYVKDNNIIAYKNLLLGVDMRCCGVSYDIDGLNENIENAVLDCLSKIINKYHGCMYENNRYFDRVHKLNLRGWIEKDDILDYPEKMTIAIEHAKRNLKFRILNGEKYIINYTSNVKKSEEISQEEIDNFFS